MTTYSLLIQTIACVINNDGFEQLNISDSDVDELLELAHEHQLGAIAATGIYRANQISKRLSDEHIATVRKKILAVSSRDMLFDNEREAILQQLEKNQIWYLPLKGIILRSMYPETYMREMADNDILFDASQADKVHEIMNSMGYQSMTYESWNHDNYTKEPFFHFEMHRWLFDDDTPSEQIIAYYKDAERLLKKDPDNQYGYHFSDEDFYLHIISHEYKHFALGGTGLRSLLDIYVYLKKYAELMDWDYIAQETEKLGLTEFEAQNRNLARKVFSNDSLEALSEKEKDLLEYFARSGTYGNKENRMTNQVKRYGMIHYLIRRVFLPMGSVRRIYPFFYKHKILIPFLPLYRLFHLKDKAAEEVKFLRNQDNWKQ